MPTLAPTVVYEDRKEDLAISASIGQQIFTISSGIAGGLAGFVLAYRLRNATRVKAQPLVIASLISAAATFAVVFMITEAEDNQ